MRVEVAVLYFQFLFSDTSGYGRLAEARIYRYEAYLDSYITPADLYFLTEAVMARQLVELG